LFRDHGHQVRGVQPDLVSSRRPVATPRDFLFRQEVPGGRRFTRPCHHLQSDRNISDPFVAPANDKPTTGIVGGFPRATCLAAASVVRRSVFKYIYLWTKRWKIKINESKSYTLPFTLKNESCPPVTWNNIPIPISPETKKYLGLILDRRLTWVLHIKNKRKALNSRLHLLRPLLRSKMNIKN
jgi:hypothetical protein